MEKIPKNAYSPRTSVVSPKGVQPAQQQFKEDCDINTIMRRFQKDGLVDHVAKYQPEYGFATPLQYHDSMNLIAHADSMFNDLPSSIRNEFSNNPQAFLKFVQDAKNWEKAEELGIALSPEATAQAETLKEAAIAAANGAPQGAPQEEPPPAEPPPVQPA